MGYFFIKTVTYVTACCQDDTFFMVRIDSVLIVCESEKTEVNCFKNLIVVHRLNTANIEIIQCQKGTAPITIVDCAIEQVKKTSLS